VKKKKSIPVGIGRRNEGKSKKKNLRVKKGAKIQIASLQRRFQMSKKGEKKSRKRKIDKLGK